MKKLVCILLCIPLIGYGQGTTYGYIYGQDGITFSEETEDDFVQTNDGGYIILGTTTYDFSNSNRDFYLVKVDNQGSKEWEKFFGSPDQDLANAVIQTSDNGFLLVGDSHTKIWVIKTNFLGQEEWSYKYGEDDVNAGALIENYSNEGYDVIEDSNGDFVICGGYTSSIINGGNATYEINSQLLKIDLYGNVVFNIRYEGEKFTS